MLYDIISYNVFVISLQDVWPSKTTRLLRLNSVICISLALENCGIIIKASQLEVLYQHVGFDVYTEVLQQNCMTTRKCYMHYNHIKRIKSILDAMQ